MKKTSIALLLLFVAVTSFAQTTANDAGKLSEGLIYSVNRTPERPFDTARSVQVITAEEIWRKNGMSLSEILSQEAGFLKYRPTANLATPIFRGLVGRQVLVLIDGVKVNDALFGDTPNLDLIDIAQVERIEIVRGVVSVLGTEALGGVINVITKRAPANGSAVGGSAAIRYSSASNGFSTPLNAYGQAGNLRWNAGGNYQKFDEIRGGDGGSAQPFTAYSQKAAHMNMQYFLSPEKTIGFSYRQSAQEDVVGVASILTGVSLRSESTPLDLQFGTLTYQDLTDRGWSESLKVTGYWNVQRSGTVDVTRRAPTVETTIAEKDRLAGINIELGSFVGSHHFVYGADLAQDKIGSWGRDRSLTTGVETARRGRYTDGATYQTAGIYAQDNFDITRWLTVTAGLRYGIFETKGDDTLPIVGEIDLDSSKSDVTGAVNLVFHATPNLNVVGSAMRGFRAPNVRDLTRFSVAATTLEIPNTEAAAERMISYEAGLKWESDRFSASAMLFKNELSNLLVISDATLNGLPYLDANANGKRDANEPTIRQNSNIGTADIDGYELEIEARATSWLSMFANYSKSDASTTDILAPTLVSRVPPPYGAAGIRFNGGGRFSPWAEASYTFTKDFVANGVVLSPEFEEFALRAGMTLNNHFRFALSGENLSDQHYIARFGTFAYPGRRLVATTEFRF